ncbi:MAG: cytochrome c [Erythrobacter sp.]|nr:cytochrome c [Erythrobacter sp.]
MDLRIVVFGLATTMALAASCAADGQEAEPAAPPRLPGQIEAVTFGLQSDEPGARLYGRECAYCHVGRNTGTIMLQHRLPEGTPAQLHERSNLPAAYVKIVVRNGMVNMPPLSRAELSDEDLDLIADWLAAGPTR